MPDEILQIEYKPVDYSSARALFLAQNPETVRSILNTTVNFSYLDEVNFFEEVSIESFDAWNNSEEGKRLQELLDEEAKLFFEGINLISPWI